jgi:hypothetical protein
MNPQHLELTPLHWRSRQIVGREKRRNKAKARAKRMFTVGSSSYEKYSRTHCSEQVQSLFGFSKRRTSEPVTKLSYQRHLGVKQEGFGQVTLAVRGRTQFPSLSTSQQCWSFSSLSQDRSLSMLGENHVFVLVIAVGSIAGSFIGGRLPSFHPFDIRCRC